MAIEPGTKLGPYEVLALIGAGGMGEVYKASDTRLNRMVAIKVLPVHFSENAEMKQRFEREAQTIAALNHPHICTVFSASRLESVSRRRRFKSAQGLQQFGTEGNYAVIMAR